MSDHDLPILELGEEPLILDGLGYSGITEMVAGVTENKAPRGWWIGFLLAGAFMTTFLGMAGYLIVTGIGAWGNNSPVFWAWDITNFVWWVGIGHAGTLI
ncbi:hydrogenase, partial [bacterium]